MAVRHVTLQLPCSRIYVRISNKGAYSCLKPIETYLAFVIIVLLGIWLLKPSEEPITEDDFSHLVRINPVPQAQQLVQQEKFAEADDYISYFMDYDYVNQDPQAIQLYTEIQDTRDDWLYKLIKANSGFWTGESDETEGQVAAVVSDFLVIGDIRDLGREGKNFIEGKDVDKVTAALSGVGVVAAGAALITAGTAATAKPAVSFLKMANKAGKMPKWLGKSLVESAEIAKKKKNLDHVAGLFSDIQGLYKTAGARSTLELLGKSKDLDDFCRLAKFGSTFGAKTSTLLKVVGDDAITAYQRLGNVPKNTFLEAATFGQDGVKAIEKHGPKKFQAFVDKTSSPYTRGRPSMQQPPQVPGEYRWRDKKTGEIEYVGETNNLARRKVEHIKSDKPVSDDTHQFEWKKADENSTSATRREHERQKIEQHDPVLNQRAGGGGRPALN